MKMSISLLRRIIKEEVVNSFTNRANYLERIHRVEEALDLGPERETQRLMKEPEFQSFDAFIEYKFDNEEDDFSTEEVHALVRNIAQRKQDRYKIVQANDPDVHEMIQKIKSYGLKYLPLKKPDNFRGATSNPHGRHPFAGSGAGGSGFGDSGFTSHGGGPGSIGSGKAWSPNSAGSLRMGAGRK